MYIYRPKLNIFYKTACSLYSYCVRRKRSKINTQIQETNTAIEVSEPQIQLPYANFLDISQ